ncbi:holin [Micromonospora rifamycinica]|uniref:holin n=1 Tax=Micromonospora rifamycinica TaxID=291594 RepID=UPI002E2ABCE6|nr:holin [Micromonospora rifamycinica]
MWTSQFWKQTLERAIKTFAQGSLALLAGDGLGVLDVDWGDVASVGALAAIASVLTSLVSVPAGEPDSPSLVQIPPTRRAPVISGR